MLNDVSIWDKYNREFSTKYPHEKVVQFCFRNYPQEQRGSIRALDLGCGSGVHMIFLAKEGFRATGIDISEVGINNTRRKLDALGLKADLHVENAAVLDFPPNSFDLVISVGVFESVGFNIAKSAVERLSQILSPGARGLFLFASNRDSVVLGDNPFNCHGFIRSEVEEIFAHGFSNVWIDQQIVTFQSGAYEQHEWLVTLVK